MAGEAVYSARWSFEDGASPSFSGSSVRWDFNADTVVKRQTLLQSGGLRGVRSTVVAQTRRAPYSVAGSLGINPSPKFLGWALPKAMGGGTETAPAFADAIPEFAMLADRGSGTATNFGDCYKYLGLKANRLSLSFRAGQLLDCEFDVLGKTETVGQTFAGAALGTSRAYEPYQHADIVLAEAVLSDTLEIVDGNLTIDNGLTARFVNSLTANEILEGSRRITLNCSVIIKEMALETFYGLGKDGLTALTLNLTNSTVSTLFTFSRVQIPDNTVRISGNEFLLPIEAEIRGATGAEFTVTNDVTP